MQRVHDQFGHQGGEWWTYTVHGDGTRTVRAMCEIEHREVTGRSVLRDVTYSMDDRFRPLDAFVRLTVNDRFRGSAWFRFAEDHAECEGFAADLGRYRQRWPLATRALAFGSHPLFCDTLLCARFDHSRPERVQRLDQVLLSSLEHDGASGPMLGAISFSIEYVGRERVTVPAGTFEADHYRFLLDGALPKDHPVEELWCVPREYTFVKVRIGGYIATSYELAEFQGPS